jgi:hypothetical protein
VNSGSYVSYPDCYLMLAVTGGAVFFLSANALASGLWMAATQDSRDKRSGRSSACICETGWETSEYSMVEYYFGLEFRTGLRLVTPA